MIVLFSELCEKRAHELRKRSYILNQLGGFDEADALRDKAREWENAASHSRFALVRPVRSQTSFAIDPQGAA